MTVSQQLWEFRAFGDVNRVCSSVRSVPGRTPGREHYHLERYFLGLYLLAPGTHRLLRYPFRVEQGDSPDFMVTWPSGEVTGLEVTGVTTQPKQHWMTEDEREWCQRGRAATAIGETPEPVVRELDDRLIGDESEQTFCKLVQYAVEQKIEIFPRYRPASRYEILLADDTPVGGIDRRKVVATLNPWVRRLEATTVKLGRTSVIISLDVLFDLGKKPRLLPYINWDAPEAERIEYAGWRAAKRALRAHAQARNPVYSMDSHGRLVKQTADGQRFEVRVGDDGAESVVAGLPRG